MGRGLNPFHTLQCACAAAEFNPYMPIDYERKHRQTV